MSSTSDPRHIVAVGGGTASCVAVRTLRRRGFDGAISIVCAEPHAPYQRPPLSKEYLSGAEGADSINLFSGDWLEKNNVRLLTGITAERVDTATATIALSNGSSLPASHVILATGGRPREFLGAAPSARVHYLRTVDDADRLRAAMRDGQRMAVIGAGYIGLEVAATARGLGLEVTVFEAAPRPLAAVLPAALTDRICTLHARNGTTIRTGVAIESLEDHGDESILRLRDGTSFAADVVVIGIGVIANTEIAQASGLAVNSGILTDTAGRTHIPEVLAAGDVAEWEVPIIGGTRRVEHFDIANRQGAAVANTILGRPSPSFEAPWFWSDQYDSNLQVVGQTVGADQIIYRGSPDELDFSALFLAENTLVGAFAIDRGEDILGARALVGQDVGAVLGQLTDESVDLLDVLDALDDAMA